MKCPHCGNTMPDGTDFCKLCGTALSSAASSAPVASMSSDAGFVLAQQEKNARKRALIRVATLVAVVIVVVVALLLSVGKSLVSNTESTDEPSQQPQQQAQQDIAAETDNADPDAPATDTENPAPATDTDAETPSTDSDDPATDDSVQAANSVNSSEGDDSSRSSAIENTQKEASLSDYIGTWICDDYDYDGVTRNFNVAFDVDACVFVYIWTANDPYCYAGVRHYSGSSGVIKDTAGFEFSLSDDKQTLILHVPESNQSHQMKSEYYFVRQADDVQCADRIFTALGWWYLTDGSYDFYLDTTGFVFRDLDAKSSTKWWIKNGNVHMEAPQEDGTIKVITMTFSEDGKTLIDALSGDTYTQTPPTSTTSDA